MNSRQDWSQASEEDRIKELHRRRVEAIKEHLEKFLMAVNEITMEELAYMELKKENNWDNPIDPIISKLFNDFWNVLVSTTHAVGLGLKKEQTIISGEAMPEIFTPVFRDLLKTNPTLLLDDNLNNKLSVLSGLGLYTPPIVASIIEAKAMNELEIPEDYQEYLKDNELLQKVALKANSFSGIGTDEFPKNLDEKKDAIRNNALNVGKKAFEKAEKIISNFKKKNTNEERNQYRQEILERCEKMNDNDLILTTYFLMQYDIASFQPEGGDDLYLRSSRANWSSLYKLCAERFDYFFFQDNVPPQMNLLNKLVTELYMDNNKYILENEERYELIIRDLAFKGISVIQDQSTTKILNEKGQKSLKEINQEIKQEINKLAKWQKAKIPVIDKQFPTQSNYIHSLMTSTKSNSSKKNVVNIALMPKATVKSNCAAVASKLEEESKKLQKKDEINMPSSEEMERIKKINKIISICEHELKRLNGEKKKNHKVEHKIAAFKALIKYLNNRKKFNDSLSDIINLAKTSIVYVPNEANKSEGSLFYRKDDEPCTYQSRFGLNQSSDLKDNQKMSATLDELLKARRGKSILFKGEVKSRTAWQKIQEIAANPNPQLISEKKSKKG